MDEDNPTLREWCLMTVRNICQNSEQIRKFIEEMKRVEGNGLNSVSRERLEEMGLKEEFMREARKYV